jgi:hypothetical protein
MIRSYWTYCGTTLVGQVSILVVRLADTLHGSLKGDLRPQCTSSITVHQ